MSAIRLLPALCAGALALALAACQKTGDQAFDKRVHDYIVAHPEVIQEAMSKLQEKQDAAVAAQTRGLIDQYRQAIEHDPHDFVANPNGHVTVTEFYDYRCPHCINAAPAVLSIIHGNPDVRFVFKEFPIFGAESDKAAAGAIAVKQAGGDVLGLYRDLMAAHPLDDAAIDRILRAHGVDPATLDRPPLKDEAVAQLQAVRELATNIGVQGTPAFVVGDTMIPGDDTEALRAAIAAAGKKTG
ncbi:MAG TPA: DsbA family protein [Caulobacteraceae bacterium]|jgi:protein-disulfide isomerase|nr:DsbA family protein [Caulobacteraceae bacterium]